MSTTTSYSDLLRLPSGPVDLQAIETNAAPGYAGDKKTGKTDLLGIGEELFDLQERLFAGKADAGRSLLLVLQGMDTSGKGGTLKDTVGLVDPQGVKITSFKAPTKEELAHDFLWRIRLAVPGPGIIGVFDRSHYEDVLIVRVRELAPPDEIERRYGAINDFEAELVESGVTLLKCMLHISPDEQKARLLARLDDPTKHWKYNPGDLGERAKWAEYRRPTRSPSSATTRSRRRGTSSRRTRSGTATWPSATCCSRRCVAWTRSGPPPTSTSRPRRRSCRTKRRHVTLENVGVTRYVTPLREGGSLPGIVEADDLGTYVCKFRGAGQGARVLVAEVVVGGLAQRLGLPTPRLVVLDLDPAIARYEADEEVQDLLNASPGANLGVDFLPGAFGYDGDPADDEPPTTRSAPVLWLDAFTANVDRTWRNPNLLRWHGDLWVIDHGAALYFHHAWAGGVTAPERFAAQPWDVADHVFGSRVGRLATVDAEVGGLLGREVLAEVLAAVPDAWLEPVPGAETPEALRAAYVDFLTARLGTRQWLPLERAS